MSDAPAASALRGVLMAIGRHMLTAAGTTLVAHGYLDQQTATGAVDPLAEYIVGAAIAGASAGFSGFKAWLMHQRWMQAWIAPARPLPPA